jgi:DNA-binding transcriptional regulator YdaS (Cro superfamily)
LVKHQKVLTKDLPNGKVRDSMNKLLSYLNGLTPSEQAAFAARCETTVGYLRKAISINQLLREKLCIKIESESGRMVLCEDLRTDVDWQFLRGTDQLVKSAQERDAEAQAASPQPSLFGAS